MELRQFLFDKLVQRSPVSPQVLKQSLSPWLSLVVGRLTTSVSKRCVRKYPAPTRKPGMKRGLNGKEKLARAVEGAPKVYKRIRLADSTIDFTLTEPKAKTNGAKSEDFTYL